MCNCKNKSIQKSTGVQQAQKPSAAPVKKTVAKRPASVKKVVVRRPL